MKWVAQSRPDLDVKILPSSVRSGRQAKTTQCNNALIIIIMLYCTNIHDWHVDIGQHMPHICLPRLKGWLKVRLLRQCFVCLHG